MWEAYLKEESQKTYFKELMQIVNKAYHDKVMYPPYELIFEAFKVCPFEKVKVVILGQDPYHQKEQAHGLAFSVSKKVKKPKSLINIYKELNSDIGCPIPSHGNLLKWCEQGVFLLNTILTVEEGRPASFKNKGWETFTDGAITLLSEKKEHLVFILWGNYAQSKRHLIDAHKHLIIESVHPSPLSASRGFFGSKPFSKCNAYLKKHHQLPIDWRIE